MGPAEEVDVSEVRARVGGHLCGRKPHGRHVEHRVLVPEQGQQSLDQFLVH